MCALPANLRYAVAHSPTLDMHVEQQGAAYVATVTTTTGEHVATADDPVDALQRALGEIGL